MEEGEASRRGGANPWSQRPRATAAKDDQEDMLVRAWRCQSENPKSKFKA